ncbi:MAG: tRNA lysidine(34) synthetase TilS [Chloroflexi bacterium]|nr:tRNA lysidine(34) synthetase TilS [Chloroflexota bacterium]
MREHYLVAAGWKLLVAVSGGPDSVCLLHILADLQKELDITLHVAHLDHQLRGAESEADARYVSGLADRLGIPATLERRDVRNYRAKRRLSLEEAAREVRYTFFAEVAESIGADSVAVGHTTDDQVETILMHLVRGTGTRGLRGLQPRSQWRLEGKSITIVRPLLEVTREETAAYCQQRGLTPRVDSSNLSLSLLRNRIRRELVPLLKKYNPQVSQALLRTASIASDDLAFIEEEVGRLWSETAREQENAIILNREKFGKLHTAAKRHLLRKAIEKLLGNLKDIETRHIDELVDALDKPAGKVITLPFGLIFSIEYERYLLTTDPAALSPFPTLEGEFTLKVPGETILPGWRIEAAIVEPAKAKEKGSKDEAFTAYLDLTKAGDRLTVRGRKSGDRFQPLGMDQTKKLSQFMIDARIPHAWRDRIPIIYSPEQIIWVVGWRIDERVKVTNGTEKVLCLEFKQR